MNKALATNLAIAAIRSHRENIAAPASSGATSTVYTPRWRTAAPERRNEADKDAASVLVRSLENDQGGVEKEEVFSFTLKQCDAIVALLNAENNTISLMEKNRPDGRVMRFLVGLGLVSKGKLFYQLTEEGKQAAIEVSAVNYSDAETHTEANAFVQRAKKLLGGDWRVSLAKSTGAHITTVGKWASGRLEVPTYVNSILDLIESVRVSGGTLPESVTEARKKVGRKPKSNA